MASVKTGWGRWFLQGWLPFLFKRCPAGNLHWRWEEVCYCTDHYRVYLFASGEQLVNCKLLDEERERTVRLEAQLAEETKKPRRRDMWGNPL